MDISAITKALTEEIRQEAFLIYRQRLIAGESGTPEEDWLKAEEEMVEREKTIGLFPLFKPYVREAAYFNYLWRLRDGVPGDALGDWLWALATMSWPWTRLPVTTSGEAIVGAPS